jgi:hypothetical protein
MNRTGHVYHHEVGRVQSKTLVVCIARGERVVFKAISGDGGKVMTSIETKRSELRADHGLGPEDRRWLWMLRKRPSFETTPEFPLKIQSSGNSAQKARKSKFESCDS